MKLKKSKVFLLFFVFLFAACTHSVHDVYVSGFDLDDQISKGKPIEARSQQFVFMGFARNTDYVDEAYESIAKQCKNGEIKGLSTQYSTSHGFFSWKNKILIKGYCF